MRLFKLEHDEKGIWYFTGTAKAAKYIDTAQSYLNQCLRIGKTCKGWSIEEIESDDIISKYINPTNRLN